MGDRAMNGLRPSPWPQGPQINAPEAVLAPRFVHAVPADGLRWVLRQRYPILCGGANCPRCSPYVVRYPDRWAVLLRSMDPPRPRWPPPAL